jgi:hypothetical protein
MRKFSLSVAVLATGLSVFCPAPLLSQTSDFFVQRHIVSLDEQPRFPGCEVTGATEREKLKCAEQKLEEYIEANLKYPPIAKKEDFRPRVVWIEVTIEMNGRAHSPKIVEEGIPEYDESAQSVFVQMTRSDLRWTPGISLGRAVRSLLRVAVRFTREGRSKAFPAETYGSDVYKMVDNVPRFAACPVKGKKDEEIMQCVSEQLSAYFAANLRYPEYARDAGIEGDVQVEYIVGKDSIVRHARVVNDIGLSNGDEVLHLFGLMNEKKIRWIPGKENDEHVDVLMKTIVPFRIENKSRAVTMQTTMDPKPLFVSGRAGFEDYLNTYLKRPQGEGISPCAFGTIEVHFKIDQLSGEISITKTVDYNNIGSKFQAAAEKFVQETAGLWNTAWPNLGPATEYYILLPFIPANVACQDVPPGYKETLYKSLEAAAMTNDKRTFNDGMDILDKSVRLYPTDNELRLLRGMSLYRNGHVVEGCVDLKFVNRNNKDIEVPKSCRN